MLNSQIYNNKNQSFLNYIKFFDYKLACENKEFEGKALGNNG